MHDAEIGGCQFRLATENDIALLRRLAEQIWRACYREMISAEQIEYMLAWMYSEEAIRQDLRDGARYEVIARDGEPIGYLACGPHGDGAEWKLHKLYVLPEYHGHGFGQQAIAHVCKITAASGARRLSLNVNKQNHRALQAYERAGFHIAESVINDIGGGFVMDDYILVRDLSPAR
jgi:ribosomal protein S18 acetylase RimI-like enzyme